MWAFVFLLGVRVLLNHCAAHWRLLHRRELSRFHGLLLALLGLFVCQVLACLWTHLIHRVCSQDWTVILPHPLESNNNRSLLPSKAEIALQP